RHTPRRPRFTSSEPLRGQPVRNPAAPRVDLYRAREPHHLAGLAPTGLRPELVPGVEVVKVLPTVSYPAVLELEDNAVANIQALAVSLRGAPLDADHAVIIICKQVVQLGLEGPSRFLPNPAEVGQGRVAALVVV